MRYVFFISHELASSLDQQLVAWITLGVFVKTFRSSFSYSSSSSSNFATIPDKDFPKVDLETRQHEKHHA